MRQFGIVVSAVLILISVPCDGDSSDSLADVESSGQETPSTPPKTRVFPRGANDESITHNVGDSTYVSVWDKVLYPLNNGESSEEQQGYTYSVDNAPSTVNFHDIYSNSLALLAEDIVGTTVKTRTTEPYKESKPRTTPKDDESFHLSKGHTQFVEFHPKKQTIPPRTILQPKFRLNATFVKKMKNKTSTTTTTTTGKPEDLVVIPIKNENHQRGLLDLLFPAARVRTFKSVFDTFKRIMSHTFR